MEILLRMWRRVVFFFRRDQMDQDLAEEMRLHLEMKAQEKREAGMSEKEAQQAASREFGNPLLLKEVSREMWGWTIVESTIKDIHYGLQMLAKNPGFSTLAVVTLALGIGANTAIFSLIDAFLWRNLPVGHPEKLVLLGHGQQWGMISGIAREYETFSYPLYRYFRDRNKVFTGLCGFGTEQATVRVRRSGVGGTTENATAKLVSGNYFEVLEVAAIVGRTLTAEDDRQEATPTIVLSYRYWSKVLNLNPAVISQSIDVNGAPFTVVGVAPPEFFGETVEANPPDMWFPISFQARVAQRPASILEGADMRWLQVMGRLRPGVSFSQVDAMLTAQLHQFLVADAGTKATQETLDEISRSHIQPTPGGPGISHLRRRYSEQLQILIAIVAVVLIIACANLANILLAKATARQREISVRLALGAGRGRLLRQLLTESVLLALLGGAAGLLVAFWGTHALLGIVFRGAQTLVVDVSPNLRVLGFMLLASLVTGVLFGLAPALHASRLDLALSLKTGVQPGVAGRRRRFGLGKGLVAGQVALSLLLIVGAGLFVRTLENLVRQDFGFERHHVLLVKISPEIADYKPNQLETLYRRIRERVNALPGVVNSGLALYTPLTGENWSGGAAIADYTPERNKNVFAAFNRVSAGYLDAMGVPILLGRAIGPQDTENAPDVAVINQTMARRYFPGENPVGKRFGWDESTKAAFEIIGVVKDTKHDYLRDEIPAMFFLPITQRSHMDMAGYAPASYAQELVVRSAGDPEQVATAVRRALREVDPGLPITGIGTLDDRVSASMNSEQLISGLAVFFGGVALLLASIGLYGLMAYAVARRTSEIGIRMALGAQVRQVLWMVFRETLLLVTVGIAIGIPLTLGMSQLVRNQLFGLSTYDPLTLGMAALLLACVAALAGYIPARRATKVDPMVALRYE
jgi:predicted permease